MKSKRMYRLLSWILALTMVFSLTVSPVYASDTSSTITTVNADETEDETTVEEETTTDNSAAETLQAQIDALPSVERVSAMDTDAQNEVYAQVSTIWDAYYELTEAEQEQVDASLLEALSDYFNGLTVEAEETATVATIGENSYTSLADAIAAVTDSTQTTITLTTNVTESNGLTISDTQNIVLELSSYTLDLGSAYIEVKGILTIQGNGTITTSNDGEGVIYANGTSAKVTLSSGSITNTGSQGYGIGCWYGGTAVINGGSITSQSAALAGNNTTGNMNFEVNGGTLTTTYGAAIYMPGQGTLNITGGTINGGISLRMGQVTISGGTINATTNSSNIDSITEYYNYSGNVWLADAIYVFGGTYTSEDTTNGNSLSLSISGGTFNCTNGQGNAVTVYNLGKVEQTSTVTISGGTFTTDTKNGNGYAVVAFSDLGVTDSTGSYGTSNNTVSTSISGGTFTGDVSEYLVSGLTQDEDGKVVTDETAYVAQIGETKYATVTEAITAATDGTETTITLLTDTEEDVVIPAGKVIALDLNGKTIKNSSSHTITNYGTLTVTDSSTESTGTVNNVTHAKAAIVNYGTAYLYGGTFTRSAEAGSSSSNNGGNSYYTIKNYNQMTIGDGTGTVTVENNGCYSSCIANGYQNTSDKANAENITGSVTPTLTINENASVSGGINCVKNDDCATLIIKGGSFTNTNGVAIQNHSTATINGGTFTANTCAVYNCGCDSTLDVGSLTITNGTFEGRTYAVYDDSLEDVAEVIISGGTFTGSTSSIATSSSSAATFAISGGTFNSDVSEYAIEGYEATETSESGIYEITALTATSNGVVASVTSGNETTYYKSLANALNAATNGSTVTLLANVELNESLIFEPSDSASVTLDLNGKTITFAYDDNNQFNGETLTDGAWGLKAASGTLTIKASSTIGDGTIKTADENTYIDVVGASGSAKLIIESGNFTTNSIYEAVVFATGSAKVEITGGTFTNSATSYAYNSGYTAGLTLNIGNSSSATISVTGGTFVGRSPAVGDDYVSTVTTFVADGYEATETSTGVYTVAAEISYVAVAYTSEVTDGTYYTTFDDVVAAIDNGTITDGMIIMLLDDATWTLTANKKITIGLTFDLNGKTLTLDGSYYVQFNPTSSTSTVAFIDSSYVSGELTGKVVGTYNSSYGMVRISKSCTVALENVIFENSGSGYAVEIGTSGGQAIDMTAENCSFVNSNTENVTSSYTYSRAMLLYGNSVSATGTLSFQNCTFETSSASNSGAALWISYGKSGTESVIKIDECIIIGNGTTMSCYALNLSSNLNSKVTVTNSSISAPNGACAVFFNYSIKSTANITFGDGNTVIGQVRFGNASSPVYLINVTGGCFDYTVDSAEEVPFVAASDTESAVSVVNLLNLTGGYFKVDVSDVVASGYACVANTGEAAGDSYKADYATAGYNYTVIEATEATDFYVKASDGSVTYFETLSAALAASTSTVYFAADCTLTDNDISTINSKGCTVTNYGSATLTYEGTLTDLVSGLNSGTVEVSTLVYQYSDSVNHTMTKVTIASGNLTSGYFQDMVFNNSTMLSYYTADDLLTEDYVLCYGSYGWQVGSAADSYVAKVDNKVYFTKLLNAMSLAGGLNDSDGEAHTVTLLTDVTYDVEMSAATAGRKLIIDLGEYTLSGHVYLLANNLTVTIQNGTISENDSTGFAVCTNGQYTGVSLTLNNVTVTNAEGYAMYLPADGTTSITDCTITGVQSGIEIRAGELNITNSTITSTGTEFGTQNNGSGTTVYGAGIAVSQHTTNKAIAVNVVDSTISGYYGIYEINYNSSNTSEVTINISEETTDTTVIKATGSDATAIYSVSVSGTEDGSITATTNSITTVAISGGHFSTDLADTKNYIANGYEAYTETDTNTYAENLYTVKVTKEYFYGANLNLDGTIGVNFYVDLNDVENASDYTMSFSVAGVAAEDAIYVEGNTVRSGGTTYQRYTVYVSSIQMADTIVASLKCNGTIVDTYEYSVLSYCHRMLQKNTTSESLKALCVALLNYGGYSQTHFGATESGLANEDLASYYSDWSDPVTTWTDEITQSLSSYESVTSGDLPSDVTLYGAQLDLGSETTIRFFLKYTGSDISAITFTFGGETVTPVAKSGGDNYNYCIEYDVPSNKLSTTYKLVVSDGTNEYTMTYGALTYTYNMLSKDSTADSLKNVVKALYYYSVAADEYFN